MFRPLFIVTYNFILLFFYLSKHLKYKNKLLSKIGFEYIDTRIDTTEHGYCGPQTAYNNTDYPYTNYGKSMGASIDSEGKQYSVWATTKISENTKINYSIKNITINDFNSLKNITFIARKLLIEYLAKAAFFIEVNLIFLIFISELIYMLNQYLAFFPPNIANDWSLKSSIESVSVKNSGLYVKYSSSSNNSISSIDVVDLIKMGILGASIRIVLIYCSTKKSSHSPIGPAGVGKHNIIPSNSSYDLSFSQPSSGSCISTKFFLPKPLYTALPTIP